MMRIAGTQVLTSGVVEDDRITLNAALSEFGGFIRGEASAAEMVRRAEDWRPNLILMDLDRDPEWVSTLKNVCRLEPKVPVILHSRIMNAHLWIDALEAGAFDVVCRPFQISELQSILRTALDQGVSASRG